MLLLCCNNSVILSGLYIKHVIYTCGYLKLPVIINALQKCIFLRKSNVNSHYIVYNNVYNLFLYVKDSEEEDSLEYY